MPHDIGCWKCGASLAALSLPFGRGERCRQCGADLHTCRQCGLYDPRAYQQCREQTVEEVRVKDRDDLLVRTRQGYYAVPVRETASNQ